MEEGRDYCGGIERVSDAAKTANLVMQALEKK